MKDDAVTRCWEPIAQAERCEVLDVLRGLALLGVLLVNLHVDFRVSLPEHILRLRAHPDWLSRAVDVLLAALLEFKAFTLFSLLFGVGLVIFADRAAARDAGADYYLVRRLVVLFGLGLTHIFLIWNGDILVLYAVCGFLLLPFLRFPALGLAAVGGLAIVLSFYLPVGFLVPDEPVMRRLADEAEQVYTEGSFRDVRAYQWRETWSFIVPLLVASLPRTWGLMAVGAAAWRARILAEPDRHRRLLWATFLSGVLLGVPGTALSVSPTSTGQLTQFLPEILVSGAFLPLALAYGAGVVLVMRSPRVLRLAAPVAALGQMALTNYLMQSVVLSLVFHGYGLGMFGQPAAVATALGVALYGLQLLLSLAWLRRYRFGPVEWLWRSLTYGRWQPLLRKQAKAMAGTGAIGDRVG